MAINKQIADKIKGFPEKPGVYIFKNASGKTLYVGKAKNLKKRVLSYFQKTDFRPFLTALLKNTSNAEYIATQNENEALILESNLIKKLRPRYNIVLKDDKSYLFVKITKEDFPRIELVRRPTEKNAKYFGPFTSAKNIRKTLRVLKRIFPYQKCNLEIKLGKPKRKKSCLYYSLGECLSHCVKPTLKIKKEYNQVIDRITQFFKGRYKEILNLLYEEMKDASLKEQFEKAANIRNQIRALEKIIAPQVAYFTKPISADAISVKTNKKMAAINLFVIRDGKIIDRKNFLFQNPLQENKRELTSFFINQYYTGLNKDLRPKEVWVENPAPRGLAGRGIKIITPQKGKKKKLLILAKENAALFLKEKIGIPREEIKKSLKELKQVLRIKKKLSRIEAFDVSNIQGIFATGSMTVFRNGAPDKSQYRKFRIKAKGKPNDTKMMKEILWRRFQKRDWPKPDLLIVDGGKPQLSTALKMAQEKKLKMPIIALAKREEEIFIPGQKKSICLPKNSPALHLLERIRDEAHRFAITYHRKLRAKIPSALDQIPGIGPKYKKALFSRFGSIDKIRKVKIKELAKITNKRVAQLIKECL